MNLRWLKENRRWVRQIDRAASQTAKHLRSGTIAAKYLTSKWVSGRIAEKTKTVEAR